MGQFKVHFETRSAFNKENKKTSFANFFFVPFSESGLFVHSKGGHSKILCNIKSAVCRFQFESENARLNL
jgi:hypothetical protein